MNIGVDVDGVLEDFSKFLVSSGTKFFSEKFDMGLVDPEAKCIEDMFCCTDKQRRKFWRECGAEYLFRQPCIDGCAEVISRLVKEGHRVFIITGRAMTRGRGPVSLFFRGVLRRWLKKNGIEYEKIVFCRNRRTEEDKRRACLKHGIDVMIDDTVSNLTAARDIVRPILFSAPWNIENEDPSLMRVSSWSDVEDAIELA